MISLMTMFQMENNTDYIPTQQEINDFNFDRMGYTRSIRVDFKKEKSTHGQLVLIEGNNVTVISYDKPWALLSSIKSQYVRNGYKKSNLHLKFLSWVITKV